MLVNVLNCTNCDLTKKIDNSYTSKVIYIRHLIIYLRHKISSLRSVRMSRQVEKQHSLNGNAVASNAVLTANSICTDTWAIRDTDSQPRPQGAFGQGLLSDEDVVPSARQMQINNLTTMNHIQLWL